MTIPEALSNSGLATDLLLLAEAGTVQPHGPYVVAKTDAAPDYFFGNLLVLPQRPDASERERLEADFAALVGVPPRIAHCTFVWPESWPPTQPVADDDLRTVLQAFVERGYDATRCRVLTARWDDVRAVAPNPTVEVRRYASQAEWDTWTRLHLAELPPGHEGSSRRYLAHQQRVYRGMIERGLGDWWGAFIDGEQVGNLGLFFVGGCARFQSVLTDERVRNRGVCRTLVAEVIRQSRAAGDEHRAAELVMVADEQYHAGRIYEALGFQATARLASLCRMPSPDDRH